MLEDGAVVVRVDLDHITGPTQDTRHTLKDDLRLINLEICGRRVIISKCKKGGRFGLLPENKIRSSVVTGNTRVLDWTEEVSASIVPVH